jgi:hypothetical protein
VGPLGGPVMQMLRDQGTGISADIMMNEGWSALGFGSSAGQWAEERARVTIRISPADQSMCGEELACMGPIAAMWTPVRREGLFEVWDELAMGRGCLGLGAGGRPGPGREMGCATRVKVTCHLSHVTCHMSHLTCHVGHMEEVV